jgi:hypothetical protein
MSHSLVKVWIHAIFATKDRASMIKDIFEAQLSTTTYTHKRKIRKRT